MIITNWLVFRMNKQRSWCRVSPRDYVGLYGFIAFGSYDDL
jgi:hypothetical protein